MRKSHPTDPYFSKLFSYYRCLYRANITKAKRAHYSAQTKSAEKKNKAYWDINCHRPVYSGVTDSDCFDANDLNDFFIKIACELWSAIPASNVNFLDYRTGCNLLNSVAPSFLFRHVTHI